MRDMRALAAIIKVVVALLYLVGACSLLPGFLWIVPEGVRRIHRGPVTIAIPIFGTRYASGVHALICGMALVLAAALLDFCVQCRPPPSPARRRRVAGPACAPGGELLPSETDGAAGGPGSCCARMLGPACQVLGSAAILAGCVAFLPRYSQAVPPREIFGIKAPDLGARLFQLGSVVYFSGALAAIRGLAYGIRGARRAGRSAWLLWLSLPAFLLFLVTSSLLFANGLLPKEEAVQAGMLRVAGAVCLLVAVVLLSAVTLCEVACQTPAPEESCRAAGNAADKATQGLSA